MKEKNTQPLGRRRQSETPPTPSGFPEGNAIVYCEGAFNTTYGKTAHGLVRFTQRYRVCAVVDSRYAGKDAGDVLDNRRAGIPVCASLADALATAAASGHPATHLVYGIAPDGGGLDAPSRAVVLDAIGNGLNIDAGLHHFLSEDPEIAEAARQKNVTLRDVRKPPSRSALHFFSGNIEKVDSLKIAVLGTDSAIGKRTTAWLLVRGFEEAGYRTQMIGTGQTAWMQGVRYGVIMDSLINDFVAGEIEHAVYSAWEETRPHVIVIEGQGSLMNPAYPGGFEILGAGRPDIIILQHAPARKEYDGFPGYPLHPLSKQIEAVELLSGKPVVAVAVNHEDIPYDRIPVVCETLADVIGIPVFDVLVDGPGAMVAALAKKYLMEPKHAQATMQNQEKRLN